MDEDHERSIAANRVAWNAAAEHHKAHSQWDDLVAGFARPGFSCLDEVATGIWREIGFEGLDVAQVCCNNGRELLSLCNLGAGRSVGFDQAAAFLDQGRELAALAGQDCAFVECEVQAIPEIYDGAFDRVFTTIGVFGWMPDLDRFFGRLARLLRPGGVFFAHEEHPLMNVFEPEGETPDLPVDSYFRSEPFAETSGLDYFGQRRYEAPIHYWYAHPLGEIVTACVRSGLTLTALREYPYNINAAAHDRYEGRAAQLPLSFALLARKEA